MIFSAAELVNIVAGVVGGEGLARVTNRPEAGSRAWLRGVARRVDRKTGRLIRDRRQFSDLAADLSVWRALDQRDEAALTVVAARFETVVVAGADAREHVANCRRVARVLADEVASSLDMVDRAVVRTHANTEQLLEDMGALAYLGLDLHERIGEVLAHLETFVDEARQQGRIVKAPSLAGFSPVLQPHVERVLAGAQELHSQAVEVGDDGTPADHPGGADADDPWLQPSFATTVFVTLLPELKKVYGDWVFDEELLMVHLVILYIDAVLRVEASIRRNIFDASSDDADDLSRVVQVDRARAESSAPDLVRRLARLAPDDTTATTLRCWLVHQAALLSPSVWEGWAAHHLADGMAALLEDRPARREQLAGMIRQLGRHAAFDQSDFPRRLSVVRLPGSGQSISVRPAVVAVAARFAWISNVDLRRVGLRLVEQLGLRTPFAFAQALGDMSEAQWVAGEKREGEQRLAIDASCSHPSVAKALIEHAEGVAAEVASIRRSGHAPAFDEVRVDAAQVRPMAGPGGRDAFDLPLVQLELAQDEVRGLLMGTALYGHPELAIRELYQNALDACRYRRVRAQYLEEVDGAPTERNDAYQGKVTITQRRLGPDLMVIECTDNGVGMAHTEIRESFAKAGKRFTDLASFQDEQARWLTVKPELRLYPNSRFGIGAFSYFMLADEVVIDTVRELPDGTLHAPLRVHVPASSGLLTISAPTTPPPEIAQGGTRVQLFVPLGSGDDAEEIRSVSVLRLLEELVWYTEVELTVREDGRRPRVWVPKELSELVGGPAARAFDTDGCRAWWTHGDGALLADGIKTNVELEGVVVDLHGTHAPDLRADRNEILSWNRFWVTDQLDAAAPTAADWTELTLAWMWRFALHWPRAGQTLFETCVVKRPLLKLGAGDKPDTEADLRIVGCFPYDAVLVGSRLGEPFPPAPPLLRSAGTSDRGKSAGWPLAIGAWRQAVVPWKKATMPGIYTPKAPTTFPLGEPVDSALLCSTFGYSGLPGSIGRLSVIGVRMLVVGAEQLGLDLAAALRRVRRLHSTGVVALWTDARCLEGVRSDGDGISLASALSSVGGSSSHEATARLSGVLQAAVAVAHDLGRPLARFAPTLELLTLDIACTLALPAELSSRVPTRREAAVLCTGGYEPLRWARVIAKADRMGVRRFEDLHQLLQPFDETLRQVGLDLRVLQELVDAPPTSREALAWSKDIDGKAPWLYGTLTSVGHILRVARQLHCEIAEAAELVMRCPGIRLGDGQRRVLDAMIVDPVELELFQAFGNPTGSIPLRNALDFAETARRHGMQPEEAATKLRRVAWAASGVPDVDWSAVEAFELDYVSRELIVVRRPGAPQDEETLELTAVESTRLMATAAKLRIDVKTLAAAAERLSVIGVTCQFPANVPDVGIPNDADVELVGSLNRDGQREPLGVIVSGVGEAAERWPEELQRALVWMEWLAGSDARPLAQVAVLRSIEPPTPVQALDALVATGVRLLERIVNGCGGAARAHVVEVCGMLAVSSNALHRAVALFEPALLVGGETIAWLPAPFDENVPDWLDVSVVSLLVARGVPLSDDWDAETKDFILGNLEADPQAIEERVRVWAPLLRADPNAGLIQDGVASTDAPLVTGMVRWPASAFRNQVSPGQMS